MLTSGEQQVRATVQIKRHDNFSIRYFFGGCIFLCCLVALLTYGFGMLGILGLIVAVIWLIFASATSLATRRWRRAMSIFTAPIALVLLTTLLHLSRFNADAARIWLWKSAYLHEVAERSIMLPSGIQVGVWPWRNRSGGFGGGSLDSDELVYDSSDQIRLPFRERTKEWLSSFVVAGYGNNVVINPEILFNPGKYDQNISVHNITGHFYLVSFFLP